jgi:hypothetical protein
LTTAFLLWLVYSAMLLVRCYSTVDGCRAWRCAVLGAVGIADLPLVVMATQWFRGMHPASPELEPAMRLVLWATVGSFALFFARLLVMRQRQLRRRLAPQARRTVEQLEREVGRPVGRKADDERRSPWEKHVWDELPARDARRAELQRQPPGAASVPAR